MIYFKNPDNDPDNPYHYHNGDQKIVITPEVYEAEKDKPYFTEIKQAVDEESNCF